MKNYEQIPAFGIAGNFAGHLEQAGEAADFASLKREIGAPKGIFPFYAPNSASFLACYPLDSAKLSIPKDKSVQVEPEIALRLALKYDENGVCELKPLGFMAFNDASIRGVKAPKISHKKNFGKASRGAGNEIALSEFKKGCICDDFSLASFIKTSAGELLELGECAELCSYGYFYEILLDWVKNTLNTQKDEAVLEDLRQFLENKPEQILLALGATRYKENMENRYLEAGDEIFILAFNHKKFSLGELKNMILASTLVSSDDISVLKQKVEFQ